MLLSHVTTVAKLRTFLRTAPLASPCYFFSPDAMSFFNSKIVEGLHVVRQSDALLLAYFITSEKFEDDPRQFTVRSVHIGRNGAAYTQDIDTVGDRHDTLREAADAIARLLAA